MRYPMSFSQFVLLAWVILATHRLALGEERAAAAVSNVGIGAFLAGHFDNAEQVAQDRMRPSVNSAAVKASAFDEAQWFALEACALRGDFGVSRIAAQVSGDEMCVAAAMGLGGKRAFFPSSIERKGDWLHYQLMYLGNPLRIDGRALKDG